MLRATLKGMFARKLRLLLAGFAIVLGVMFVSGTFVLSDTLNRSIDALVQGAYAETDVSVARDVDKNGIAVGAASVPATVVKQIDAVPGVAQAVGEITGDARVVGPDGKVVGRQKVGVGWNGHSLLAQMRQGREPRADDEIAVNAKLAADGKFQVGDRVGVLTVQPRKTFTVVGVFGYADGRDTLDGSVVVAFTDKAAQDLLLDAPEAYDAVAVRADEGTSADSLRAAVAAAVGPGFEVQTGQQLIDETSKESRENNSTLTNILLGFAGVSLFVGIFLILNTFSVIVAQRLKELALMRAIGASRRQALIAVMLEATVTGLVGATLGLLIGVGLGTVLAFVLGKLFGAELPTVDTQAPVSAIVAAYAVGLLVTWVAALAPALRASRIAPLAALQEVNTPDRPLTKITVSGAVVTAVGVALLGVGLFGDTGAPAAAILGGVTLTFIGIALLTPMLARPVVSLIGRIFSWSLPGTLGRLNSGRNPRRTAVTAAALMVGLALVVGITVVADSLKSSLVKVGKEDIRAQLFIGGDLTSGGRFAAEIANRAAELPGVAAVSGESYDVALVNGKQQGVNGATDVAAYAQNYSLRAVQGSLGALSGDRTILDEETAKELGVGLGSQLKVQLPRGEHTVTVAGVYAKSDIGGGLVVPTEVAKDFSSPQLTIASVRLAPGADVSDVRERLKALVADDPEITVKDSDEFIEQFTAQVDVLLNVVQVLLALAIVIAVLGVINTMALSILERTREFGMLRGIGMRRRQVVHMVTVESIVIALFGALLGVVVGAGLGAAAAQAMKGVITNITMPWGSMLGYLVLAAIIGVIAAVLPSIRAARVDVLKAISYQ